MAEGAFWHGTVDELRDLVAAGRRHCLCQLAPGGSVLALCTVHRMIRQDQRVLDGLVFARRIAQQLIQEEQCLVAVPATSRRGAASRRHP